MKNFILALSLLIVGISQVFCQTDTLMVSKRNANTKIILGSTLMVSGIIMSQSTTHGHRVGIPCFMIGITLTSFSHERKKYLKSLN